MPSTAQILSTATITAAYISFLPTLTNVSAFQMVNHPPSKDMLVQTELHVTHLGGELWVVVDSCWGSGYTISSNVRPGEHEYLPRSASASDLLRVLCEVTTSGVRQG